jgi:hypothetical protein
MASFKQMIASKVVKADEDMIVQPLSPEEETQAIIEWIVAGGNRCGYVGSYHRTASITINGKSEVHDFEYTAARFAFKATLRVRDVRKEEEEILSALFHQVVVEESPVAVLRARWAAEETESVCSDFQSISSGPMSDCSTERVFQKEASSASIATTPAVLDIFQKINAVVAKAVGESKVDSADGSTCSSSRSSSASSPSAKNFLIAPTVAPKNLPAVRRFRMIGAALNLAKAKSAK